MSDVISFRDKDSVLVKGGNKGFERLRESRYELLNGVRFRKGKGYVDFSETVLESSHFRAEFANPSSYRLECKEVLLCRDASEFSSSPFFEVST